MKKIQITPYVSGLNFVKKQSVMVKQIMKKCPNCHEKCINISEFSGKCPHCQEAVQTSTFFSIGLMIAMMVVMSIGLYINSYFLTTIGFFIIVVYKLFSYQIDLLLFPLVIKIKQ